MVSSVLRIIYVMANQLLSPLLGVLVLPTVVKGVSSKTKKVMEEKRERHGGSSSSSSSSSSSGGGRGWLRVTLE